MVNRSFRKRLPDDADRYFERGIFRPVFAVEADRTDGFRGDA